MADSLYGLSRYKPSASATNDSDSPDVYIDEVGTGQGSTDSSSSGLAKGIRVGANGKTIYQVRRRIDELTEGGLARFASFVSVDGEPSYTGPKGEINYPPGTKVQLFHKYTGSGSDTRPGLEDSTYMSWDRISTGVSFNPSSGSSFGPGQLTIHRPIIVECGDSHYSSHHTMTPVLRSSETLGTIKSTPAWRGTGRPQLTLRQSFFQIRTRTHLPKNGSA
jgi:hypothetical protein